MFLVLSGYLIASIILKARLERPLFCCVLGAAELFGFGREYYLLLIIVCVRGIRRRRGLSSGGLITHLTFTQNLACYWSGPIPLFPPEAMQTWVLAIEEQFYLLWPILALIVGRRYLTIVAFWLMINSIVARTFGLSQVFLARCDGLALGSISGHDFKRQYAIVQAKPFGWVPYS